MKWKSFNFLIPHLVFCTDILAYIWKWTYIRKHKKNKIKKSLNIKSSPQIHTLSHQLLYLFFPLHRQISLWMSSTFTLLPNLPVSPQTMEISILFPPCNLSTTWKKALIFVLGEVGLTNWVAETTKFFLVILEARSQVIIEGSLHGFQLTLFSNSHMMGSREMKRRRGENWSEWKFSVSLLIKTLILSWGLPPYD